MASNVLYYTALPFKALMLDSKMGPLRIGARISAALAASLVLVGAGEARAAASPWWEHDQGAVRLISATDAVGDAETLSLGLHFRMKPGWKIYWRSPGDAGFPPRPNWAGSQNLADATLSWPAPVRFEVLGLQTLGYRDEVVFPVSASVFEPGRAVHLRASVPFLTCDDVCIPYTAELSLDLPAGGETTSREAALIGSFAGRVPHRGDSASLSIENAVYAASGSQPVLRVRVRAAQPLSGPDLFVEGPDTLAFGRPEVRLSDGGRSALLRIPVSAAGETVSDLTAMPVTLTLVDGDRAMEKPVAVERAVAVNDPEQSAVGSSLLVALALGFLGGLILNLMPCVLPVLSIKVLSVIGHGGGARGAVRAGFLASVGGIMASFMVLAVAAVALRSAGAAAGWGIQFQEPLFLVVMVVILTLFACNLWGLFEVRLPGAVSDAAARAGGGHRHSLIGHFLTGAFATVLATPCTAPFLGTAVGFALSRGPAEIFAVFAALGLGLGAPYLVIAAAPGLAIRLPRPGPWMIMVKRVLAVALVATALWLLSVLAVQTGYAIAVMIALLMITTALVLVQLRHMPARARGTSWAVVGALAVLSVVATAGTRSGVGGPATAGDDHWRPFDRAAITREVSEGRVVLVDVTADWCLTCQVNKTLVLDRDPVLSRLESSVVAMRADWTRPDPEIAAYLESFGRYGIPFNVVYGPGTPDGEPLPELLTADAVMGAFDRAAGAATISSR